MLDDIERSAAGFESGLALCRELAQVLFDDRVVAARNGAGTALRCE